MAATMIWMITTSLMIVATGDKLSHKDSASNFLLYSNNNQQLNGTATLRQFNTTVLPNQGICIGNVSLKPPSIFSPWKYSIESIFKNFYNSYKDCVVIVGNLELSLMETTKNEDFQNYTFPNLREVTDFIVVYRVSGLDSLSQIFPNLARIRGRQLLHNYALIIHDMVSFKEIGLYSLVKIDRGGVIVWAVPEVCYANTIDWNTIAPQSRHVIAQQTLLAHCNLPCSCSLSLTYNHCWNRRKCQIFLDGPEANKCHEQCLGCRNTNGTQCILCRNYTNNGFCVSQCPPNTLIFPDSQYCISVEECINLSGFVWNNTCLFECPVDYVKENTTKGPSCRHCINCTKTCKDLSIQSVSSIQEAGHCVYINGSLTIHVRAVKEAMDEFRTYLSSIQEVTDYVYIHGSLTILSLDFLSSLRRIRGRKLFNNMYSLVISNMDNLQALFTNDVTEKIEIDNGTVRMTDNPMLCMSEIAKLLPKFKKQPIFDVDLPKGKNGYSAGCKEMSAGVQIRSVNQTSALVMFVAENLNAHYSVLYVRLPPGARQTIVPETCSQYEWNAVDAELNHGHVFAVAQLTSLRPASVYAICIESFDPYQSNLARSTIYNFTTSAGIPEPPFINELAASSLGKVVIHWVDHLDHRFHLKRYELDVSLVPILEKDILVKDQCEHAEDYELDLSRHAVVMRPPEEYARGCESMCGVLSEGAMAEEYFDVCSLIDCFNINETVISSNSYFGKYVNTLVLNLTAPINDIEIGGLAPYRDYRFRIRACTDTQCSRTARSVVRTLAMENADIPIIKYIHIDDFSHITIAWEPPIYVNGAILSYVVEVWSKNKFDALLDPNPQWWCVMANHTYTVVSPLEADTYLFRVCSRSMAFDKTCSELKAIVKITPTWWSAGVIFGVFVYTMSIYIGYLSIRYRDSLSMCLDYLIMKYRASDRVPIVDVTSTVRNESDPPSKMFSDFAYTVPLRESKLL